MIETKGTDCERVGRYRAVSDGLFIGGDEQRGIFKRV